MDGDELGQHLNEVVSSKMKVPYKFVVGSARDSCATNGAALRIVKPLLPAMASILCYSHMLQGTGTRFKFEALDEFMTPFLMLQSMAIAKVLRNCRHLNEELLKD